MREYERRRCRPARLIVLALALVWTFVGSGSAGGQSAVGSGPVSAERQDLRARIAELEARIATASGAEMENVRIELEGLKTRLEEGDFGPGDMVALTVVGEEALSDTFVVEPPRQLRLPGLRPIDLTGVLHSEIEPHLRQEIGRFVRDPQVMARPLVRVGVLGAVARPGFYLMPPTAPVLDVFGAAGGFDRRAQVEKLELRRYGQRLLRSDSLRHAMSRGTSLASLGVQAGDEFYVPEGEGPIRTREWILIASGVVGITLSILRIAGEI